jgi:hypothetical protein
LVPSIWWRKVFRGLTPVRRGRETHHCGRGTVLTQDDEDRDVLFFLEAVALNKPTHMRFGPTETAGQQSGLVPPPTAHPSAGFGDHAIRAHLADFGINAPVGRNGVERVFHVVADPADNRAYS